MTPDDTTRLVCQKLQRFADCAEDGDGCDIGRDWFDALTLLGLLERTKRNPAEWTMTPAGHDTLAQHGKAGGVAEIPTGTKVSVDVSTGEEDFEHRIFATVIGVERGEKPVILCEEESRNFANPPEAGVTDEMVERYCEATYLGFSSMRPLVQEHFRKAVRIGLTAAHAPQPKDATARARNGDPDTIVPAPSSRKRPPAPAKKDAT